MEQEGGMSVKDINILGEELHHDVCGNMGEAVTPEPCSSFASFLRAG